MLHIRERYFARKSIHLVLLAVAMMWLALGSSTRIDAQHQTAGSTAANVQASRKAKLEEEPAFREYKGVYIGMDTDEARKKLGDPKDKSDAQDFFVFSETETAQIFYDASHKVSAISVDYLGEGNGAPICKSVLGSDVEAKADGSIYKMVRYPKAGYWISYSRTAGDKPLISVTIQKIAQ